MHETWHTTLFGIHYYVEVLRIVNHSHIVEISFKLRFSGFLSVFGTFAHNVAETWFVLQETWRITVFGVYYCVEVVIIVNHSHMVEITC